MTHDTTPAPTEPPETRVQRAAQVGDEIRLLEEKRTRVWREGAFFLGLLGVVTIAVAVETGNPFFVGTVVLFFLGALRSYQMRSARLEARRLEAEEEFRALTSGGP